MFVFGAVLSLPGTLLGLPEVQAQFRLTLADRGAFVSALFVGLLIGSVLSGPLVDRLGQRASLVVSALLVAVCFPLLTMASTLTLAGAALGAVGLVCAGMNTAANALCSDLFPEERARRMNGIALMVGLGGLALPTVAALADGVLSWRAIVVGLGGLAALVGIAGAGARLPASMLRDEETAGGGFAHFARQPGFAWFCLLLMLGAATESSIAGWTSTFLIEAGFTPESATWALSSHWLGLVVGRLLFSGRVDRAKSTAIVRGAAAGALCIAMFVAARATWALAIGPFTIGLAIAVVVPTSLALAGERYRGNAGTLFGMLLTLAQVGGIMVPSLIGLVADAAGVRAGLSLLVVNGILIAAVTRRASHTAPVA